MKVVELFESNSFKRFRVSGVKTFDKLKKHQDLLKHAGDDTVIIDVTDEDRVKKAPEENKWNAIGSLYARDTDEIVCAKGTGDDWYCLAINIEYR